MDLSQFDARKKAEDGVFVQLKDQYTGKPIGKGDSAPGFMVRGVAAPSVQSRLAELHREAKDSASDGDESAAMEKLHQTLIESAMRYIERAVNIEIDGKPVEADKSGIRRVLDMTFPALRIVKDKDGNPVTQNIKRDILDDDGKKTGDHEWIDVPKFEMANEPWAQQVIRAAEDGQRFFGKMPTG